MGEFQAVFHHRKRLIGITENANRKSAGRVATNAGVMSAEPKRLSMVLPRIIDRDALFGVVAACGEFAKVKSGGASGVMVLEGKFRVAATFC
ncbi:MAG: hypothetical protein VCB77_11745 [Alphaproteobacteria bacterium]